MKKTVAEVMSDRHVSIQAYQSVPEAARIMHDKKVRRLPVVDENSQVIRIVTQGDVIKMMAMD